jgi:hypothetical protein
MFTTVALGVTALGFLLSSLMMWLGLGCARGRSRRIHGRRPRSGHSAAAELVVAQALVEAEEGVRSARARARTAAGVNSLVCSPPWRRSPAQAFSLRPRGCGSLRAELDHLWKVERPRVTAEVGAAAALGDRSENAEYIYGKRRLREIDSASSFSPSASTS